MADLSQLINRLRGQVSRGEVVLFTGAGFSKDAKSRSKQFVPMPSELRDLLYQIAFPSDSIDNDTTLGEAFAIAVSRNKNAVKALFESRLSVSSESLPDYYQLYFSIPWYRIYTLNIDDLELAANARYTLRRTPLTVSATAPHDAPIGRPNANNVEVIHLNGVVLQNLDRLTFSEPQYAERSAGPDTWYSRCVVDLRVKPIVYVGTTLRESTLWHHVELRRRNPHASIDVLPPGSIIVTPTISRARVEMLAALNVDWFEGSAEDFARQVLVHLSDAAQKGFTCLETYNVDYGRTGVPLVSELAAERPRVDTEYLMGEEPQWADILTGRAATRASDNDLLDAANRILNGTDLATALAVTGTAGAGKSTALMKLALQLTGADVPVFWIDRESRATPSAIRKKISETDGRLALLIDDADMFGSQVVSMIRDMVPSRPHFLFGIGVRSTKIDSVADPLTRTKEVALREHVCPPLSDEDIDSLISVLDRNNRLGILKGAPDSARRKAFVDKCGRQLLVAMLEATSGERFEDKCCSEYMNLEPVQQFIYCLLSVAMTQRHYLTRDEILLSCAGIPGDPMDHLHRLSARHVIVALPSGMHYRARHRAIADIVFDHLQSQRQLAPPLKALAIAFASKVDLRATSARDRINAFLARIMNHAFLLGVLPLADARDIYNVTESLLSESYHYWLQRGSLEVEAGDLKRAEMFLNQARSLSGTDYRVDTEYGYLLMRKAIEKPTDLAATGWIEEGTKLLEGVIALRGAQDHYPYHVLGSQGLAWASRSARNADEQRRLLSYSLHVVDQGLSKHPTSRDLKQLRRDIQQRILMTTVRP